MDEQKFMQPQDEMTQKHDMENASKTEHHSGSAAGLWGIVLFLMFATIALVVYALYKQTDLKDTMMKTATEPAQEVKMAKPDMTEETTDVMPDDTNKNETQVTEELIMEADGMNETDLDVQLNTNQLNDL